MATTTTGTVVGYFATEAQAETAVAALRTAGFSSNQIGIALSSESGYAQDGAAQTTAGAHPAGHAATHGAESAWERFKSFFGDSSDVEPYADESARGTAESHEITGSHAYDHDDFSQSLSGLSVPDDRSRYFSHRFGSAAQGAVVTVSATGREAEAETILAQHGGDTGADSTSYDYSAQPAALTTGERRVQLLGEVLRVQKDRISRGEVRIRKEVITEQQTVQVPVTREELVIERIPASGVATVAGQIGTDSEIRIPLSEERAYADKDTVVREEVLIGKRTVEEVQQVGGSVRHEELEVEDTTSPTTFQK